MAGRFLAEPSLLNYLTDFSVEAGIFSKSLKKKFPYYLRLPRICRVALSMNTTYCPVETAELSMNCLHL